MQVMLISKFYRGYKMNEITPSTSYSQHSDINMHGLTPRPGTALLMCLKKYSAIGNSAIGNYVVLYSKLTLKKCY